MRTINKFCKDTKNQEKSFEQNHKEVMLLFEMVENDLKLVYENGKSDPLVREKTFAYYFISKLKEEINDYYNNKLEINGVE